VRVTVRSFTGGHEARVRAKGSIVHQRNDTEFATMHLRTGPRLGYAEPGDRTGEAVIFFPGCTDSWYSSNWVLPSPKYYAFTFEQRGNGESELPQQVVRDSGAFARDTPPAGSKA